MFKKEFLVIFLAIIACFSACNKPQAPLTELDAVIAYLESESIEDNSPENPVSLPLNIPLGIMTEADSNWQLLLNIINDAGKYINLDLSACEIEGTEFDPVKNVETGKLYITSLLLPAEIETVTSFEHFNNLKSINGTDGITRLRSSTFVNCASLLSVSFPAVEVLFNNVFVDCTGLTSVSFPDLKEVYDDAFKGCTELTSITISEDCGIWSEDWDASYTERFTDFTRYYLDQNKGKGTYKWNGSAWTGPI